MTWHDTDPGGFGIVMLTLAVWLLPTTIMTARANARRRRARRRK